MVSVETPLKEHALLISKDWQCEEAKITLSHGQFVGLEVVLLAIIKLISVCEK